MDTQKEIRELQLKIDQLKSKENFKNIEQGWEKIKNFFEKHSDKDFCSYTLNKDGSFESLYIKRIEKVRHQPTFPGIGYMVVDYTELQIGYDYKSKGYFIEPTVILTTNPKYTTMETELFGPVVTIYVYEDAKWAETLELVDTTSEYALTGAVFSQDRYAIEEATVALQNAAGNFYINDKPTGAVVGMQPFGGARGSGTNDKAGSMQNLLRWTSARTIKETFVTPEDYRYPFLGE